MKPVARLLVLATATIALAQAPAASHTYMHPLGFSYSVPGDREVLDLNAGLADVKQKANEAAKSEEDKKGVGCIEVGLTARHQGSVIVEVALPFDCYGQTLTDRELPSFGEGAAEGIENSFTVSDPVTSPYALGSHHLWIERTKATPKSEPGGQYTVKIVCTLLKKAAVCWMAMAADDSSLAVFEHGAVTLEGDAPVALVSANAFASKPM